MSAHTLGPWKPEILPHRNSLIVSVVADNDDETMVCECYEGEDDERVAYARLIAAAPDLLAALKAFPGFTDNAKIGDAWVDRIRAAIAKAEGRAA